MTTEQQTITSEQLTALQAVINDVGELSDEERLRLLSMIALLMPAIRKSGDAGALLILAEHTGNGMVHLGLSTYGLHPAQVVATLETVAAMARQGSEHPLGTAPETLQ